jgi:predicted mannosyl-3-phosphoglycerate phosphatase (HAD superfamily)
MSLFSTTDEAAMRLTYKTRRSVVRNERQYTVSGGYIDVPMSDSMTEERTIRNPTEADMRFVRNDPSVIEYRVDNDY